MLSNRVKLSYGLAPGIPAFVVKDNHPILTANAKNQINFAYVKFRNLNLFPS